jgi:hypothetical protein
VEELGGAVEFGRPLVAAVLGLGEQPTAAPTSPNTPPGAPKPSTARTSPAPRSGVSTSTSAAGTAASTSPGSSSAMVGAQSLQGCGGWPDRWRRLGWRGV